MIFAAAVSVSVVSVEKFLVSRCYRVFPPRSWQTIARPSLLILELGVESGACTRRTAGESTFEIGPTARSRYRTYRNTFDLMPSGKGELNPGTGACRGRITLVRYLPITLELAPVDFLFLVGKLKHHA